MDGMGNSIHLNPSSFFGPCHCSVASPSRWSWLMWLSIGDHRRWWDDCLLEMIGHKISLQRFCLQHGGHKLLIKRTYRVYMHTYMFPLPHVTYIVVAAFSLTWTSDQVAICYSNCRVSKVTYLYHIHSKKLFCQSWTWTDWNSQFLSTQRFTTSPLPPVPRKKMVVNFESKK